MIHRERLAARIVLVGVTVLVVGVLLYFAARSVDGGLAGILLSGLFGWIVFALALDAVRGMWRGSRQVAAHHAIIGGCLTAVALCGIAGFLTVFGNQLLLGLVAGAVITFLSDRGRVPSWHQLVGLGSTPARAAGTDPPPLLPISFLAGPQGMAVAAVVALVCVVAGIFFAGLGTIRSLEGVTVLTDFGCSPPCAMVHGLWVEVVSDSHGKVVFQTDAATIEVRVSFRDDVPGERVASAAEFVLTGPALTYQQSLARPECKLWVLRLHLDDRSGVETLCFAIPPGVSVVPDELVLNWTQFGVPAMIPLGRSDSAAGNLHVGT